MMRAAVLAGIGRIRVIRCPRPVPRRGEVLVRVRAVGICRSDVHYYRTGRIGDAVIRRWPQMLGHEPAGEVAWPGPGVRGWRPGDRVAVEPAEPCGRCGNCRSGRGNICPRVRFLGMPGRPGALAEYVVMPAGNLVRLPAAVPFAIGAALEPFAIGMHAVRLVKRRIREAAVVGTGPVGLSVVAALRLAGARVTAFDYLPGRLRKARRMGAGAAFPVRRGEPMAAAAGRAGKGWDAVFEAGGTWQAVELALTLAAPGGTVALIGIMEEDRTPVNLHTARRKELAILNVRRSNDELAECVRLVGRGRVGLAPMITHRGGLDAAPRLFAMAERYSGGIVKGIIEP